MQSREKDEAGRKLEELAESVNVSIKSIVQERETMMKKNQELSHKLQVGYLFHLLLAASAHGDCGFGAGG